MSLWYRRRQVALVFTLIIIVSGVFLIYHSSPGNAFVGHNGERSMEKSTSKSGVNAPQSELSVDSFFKFENAPQDSFNGDNLNMKWSMPLGPALKIVHNSQQAAIVKAIQHAWAGYKKYAWGADELLPLSKKGTSVGYGLSMTMIDCLDTLWLAGLQEEFDEARDWIRENLDISHVTKSVSLFETNIRVLGGLLSAYHLSLDHLFLDKAIELADHLLPAFNTPSGVPVPLLNLKRGIKGSRSLSVAEAGTLQLEFRDVSFASGNNSYQAACDRDMDVLLQESHGLLMPGSVNPQTGKLQRTVYSVGAGIDSYYEYLLKQWLQSGKAEKKFLTAYLSSVQEVATHLVGHTGKSNLPFVGRASTKGSIPLPVMDHLSCFYPGMLGLGLFHGLHPDQAELAEGLTETCYTAYKSTPSGLAPEIFRLNTKQDADEDVVIRGSRVADSSNILRPETVESIFYLFRLTQDEKYRTWGWRIFEAFEKNTRVNSGGYAGVWSVITTDKKIDKMESFFISETLKYLFLLFSEHSVLSLDHWVFNTEAHPLPIWAHYSEES